MGGTPLFSVCGSIVKISLCVNDMVSLTADPLKIKSACGTKVFINPADAEILFPSIIHAA